MIKLEVEMEVKNESELEVEVKNESEIEVELEEEVLKKIYTVNAKKE